MTAPSRLPETRRLNDILPSGREGGLEFARIVDLLLFHEARRQGRALTLFSDRAGDYQGLDSFADDDLRVNCRVGYQYKFYPSPLSQAHRSSIKEAIVKAQDSQMGLKQRQRLTRWILVTPDDLIESSNRRPGGGDVSWFFRLASELNCKFELDHWGHRKLQALFLDTPTLCLFYYPELVPAGASRRRTIEATRLSFDQNLQALYGRIEFVGMSAYKPEASRGVLMEHIYIPLTIVGEQADDRNEATPRGRPGDLLRPLGGRHVILGDPGSGKSTLLRFLALVGCSEALQQRYGGVPDRRIPILVILRRYSDALKDEPDLAILDYIVRNLRADFSLPHVDQSFLEFYLDSGEALLLFDGMDELPNPRFKKVIRDRVHCLLDTYPGNTAIITSRVVGYENPYRFDDTSYSHWRLARLALPEMERFVADWYAMRVENPAERQANVDDLVRILHDPQQKAIGELACNPLLLTIIALIHRIDAVLPDERVVLYHKCTETLLNTWQNWKFRHGDAREGRGKIERRNRRRIKALAHWMHDQAGGTKADQRAVVSHAQTTAFLTEHIRRYERLEDPDDAEDLAQDFLDFVKRRAGLLLEVGDRQYSFIHLTCQEYLTATHLAGRMELVGVESLWPEIATRVVDPRWHEVLRLLAAGLRASDSQAYLLERLLELPRYPDCTHTALLLGGLLLDGIEAAELEAVAISELLLAACAIETTLEWVLRLLSQIRGLIGRSPDGGYLDKAYRRVWRDASAHARGNLLLAAFAAGMGEPKITELTGHSLDQPGFQWQRLLLTTMPCQVWPPESQEKLESFVVALAYWATSGVWPNHLAGLAEGVIPREISTRLSFIFRLFLISNLNDGPFAIFGTYPAWLISPDIMQPLSVDSDLLRNQRPTHEAALSRALRPTPAPRRSREPAMDITRSRMRARDRALSQPWGTGLDKALSRDRRRFLNSAMVELRGAGQNAGDLWMKMMSDPQLSEDITYLVLEGLSLPSSPLWQEALRTCLLPRIPERLWLYQSETWRLVEGSFVRRVTNENDCYAAACILLYDLWLFLSGAYSAPGKSPFTRLAKLTRENNHPALRIAHCLRDLGFDRNDRAEDLTTMVQSTDPAYRRLFQDAMWID